MVPNNLAPEDNCDAQLDLEQLIADVEDVTEPSSMDKVLEYVEKIQEDDEKFFELLTHRLQHAEIYWEQPWYQKENRLSRPLRLVGDNETTTFRTDSISQEENDLIARNWRKFRKKFKLPDQLISLARWKNINKTKNPRLCVEEQARRYAAAYLARGLQRNPYQVFRHILAHYGGHRRGFYSSTEQKIIEICFHHKPRLVGKILSLVLGREPRGVYKRLAFMLNGKPEKKRLKWNLERASKLVQGLLKYTELELDDLKNRKIEKWIWRKLEEDMDQSEIYLQHFWYCYLHVQLFVRCDVKLSKLKKRLFKKLRTKASESTYKVWSDIRWKDITLDFPDGFTPRFLYRICNIFIKNYKGYLRAPLEDVVEFALQKIKKEKGMKRNKRLKTLRLNKDGGLEVADYAINSNE